MVSVGKRRGPVTCCTKFPNDRKWCAVMFSITMRQKFYIHEFKISKMCRDIKMYKGEAKANQLMKDWRNEQIILLKIYKYFI